MSWLAFGLVALFEAFLLGNLAYLLFTLAGAIGDRIRPRREAGPRVERPHRFVVLIAARNEERVVGDAVRSALAQQYPGGHRVAVVADNCADQTADVARAAGAEVFERWSGGQSTKGHALAWLWEALPDRHRVDAVAVLDADNLAAPDFLSRIDRELRAGQRAIQGLRASRDPEVGHAGRLDGLAEALNQRVEAAGRRWWGLSGPLSGSGMAFDAATFDMLARRGTRTMVEDLEWQLGLLEQGIPVQWSPAAVVFDEKVADFGDLRVQRSRWIRGKVDLVRLHLARALGRALCGQRGGAQSLLVLLAVLPRSLLGAGLVAGAVAAWAVPGVPGLLPLRIWLVALVSLALWVALGIALVRPDRDLWRTLPHVPRFLLALVASFWLALVKRHNWVATPHYGKSRIRYARSRGRRAINHGDSE